jgi:hypothetical protein
VRLLDRLAARRRRKAHIRYERERERQRRLQDQDPQEAIRNTTRGAGPSGTPHNS